jgi:hypothetical protein
MSKVWPAFRAVLLALSLGIPVSAYDIPLTENSIREAYFLGTRLGGLNPEFLAGYVRLVPDLKQGNCTSQARLETPFLEVAEYASKVPNYSAQSAVKDFSGKPLSFRIYLEVCYRRRAPANAVTVKIIQNKKEVVANSFESSPYSESTEFGFLPPNGERIVLEFMAAKIDSGDLTVLIDTSDGQHGETKFNLQALR